MDTLTPEFDTLEAPYWAALNQGRLTFQRCACGHTWLPARARCPACLGTAWSWQDAGGGATLESWVIYHIAYHPAFKDQVPYNVALVQLDEGPRMITNVLAGQEQLSAGARLHAVIDLKAAVPLAKFVLD